MATRRRSYWCRYGISYLLILLSVTIPTVDVSESHADTIPPATVVPMAANTPARIAGHNGVGDERDVDLYPALAYDQATQRYLVVWLSLRNAGSRGDGFDVYGHFLNRDGQPLGGPFRISDSNTVARNSPPAVAAGPDGFAVVWTVRGNPCRLFVQQVFDTSPRPDRPVSVGAITHQHSPRLIYNPARQRFVLAVATGDDYLPPTLFGGASADCGNSATSTSQVRVAELTFADGLPQVAFPLTVSEAQGGAFRPAIGYSAASDRYLVVWEDRRRAAGEPYLFDVYAQWLDGDLTADGTNFALATGASYVNSDSSGTWTPRPAVAASSNTFLATWFTREGAGEVALWQVQGQLFAANGVGQKLAIAEMTFVQTAGKSPPVGFLDVVYQPATREFLVAMTTHVESVFGYFSSARIQRVNVDGSLLRLNGSPQEGSGIGSAIDFTSNDQISLSAAANDTSSHSGGYLVVYGKHAPNQHSQDFDLWRSQLVPPTNTPTPSPTFTPTATATPTATQTPIPAAGDNRMYLPIIRR